LNRLTSEKSPYLLQHADNPVDWYPWSEDAFEKARREQKPVFLSIGYSTCHWCHVMEHESFEDSRVAELMNDTFVCIKVDREERPDIDNLYMAVCQMMTGSGGWPLTIVMTPDKKPFFATTYIPKDSRFGRVGMLELVPRLKEIWNARRQDVINSADEITDAIRTIPPDSSPGVLDASILKEAFDQLNRRYDEFHGGFGSAPKFPTPHQLSFLLRYWKRTGDSKALNMVDKTLHAMRNGGIYDHVGFGFHRYSTDRSWLVPHFEKMLYDQALLATAYTEAFQVTAKSEFAQTAHEIFTYVLRDLTSPNGGFYSAEDADSEGEEGKFYLWSEDEIRKILGTDAEPILGLYNVKTEGNFVDQLTGENPGTNILHLTDSEKATSASEESLIHTMEAARQKLFEIREQRVHPHKDDKILTDWNGLMIASLAKAAQVWQKPEYLEAARKAIDFILKNMRKNTGALLHRYRDGDAAITGHVDDYAFFIWGLLEFYEASFESRYLEIALSLNDYFLKHFWDSDHGGFFFTADDAENLLLRTKEIYDGAVPSGNSVALLNLLRLSRITGRTDLEEYASKLSQAFANQVRAIPSAHTQFLTGVDFGLGPSFEIVIAGDSRSEDTKKMLRTIQSHFLPNKVLLLRPTEVPEPEIVTVAPFAKPHQAVDGKATAYVCRNYICNRPVTKIVDLEKLLSSTG
jgi:uncharacterized protein YyaL (SSP411 family)